MRINNQLRRCTLYFTMLYAPFWSLCLIAESFFFRTVANLNKFFPTRKNDKISRNRARARKTYDERGKWNLPRIYTRKKNQLQGILLWNTNQNTISSTTKACLNKKCCNMNKVARIIIISDIIRCFARFLHLHTKRSWIYLNRGFCHLRRKFDDENNEDDEKNSSPRLLC